MTKNKDEYQHTEKYGYQPKEDQRGFQPANSKPQQPENGTKPINSNGNVSQDK